MPEYEQLEVESDLGGQGAGSNVVRAAERREEIVQREFVRDVDRGEADAPLVAVAVEQVVVADGHVKQVPRRNSLRIVVVVFRVRRRYFHQARVQLGRRADEKPVYSWPCGYGRRRGRAHPVTGEPRLELLIGGKRQSVKVIHQGYIARRNVS